MFLMRTLDADGKSVWLAGYEGLKPEPISFDDGLRRLFAHRVADSKTEISDQDRFSNKARAGLSFQAPFAGTKILCVGRNYRSHADEFGNPIPSEPLWFSKPPSSILEQGELSFFP